MGLNHELRLLMMVLKESAPRVDDVFDEEWAKS
jgi:hypothetical protein